MTPIAGNLLLDLRRFHLLEPAQFDELAGNIAQFPSEPKALAQELMRRGWLTPYQVNRLLQGRGHELLLGSYILLERLGEGGMGAVFKARNWKLGALRAVKIIRKDRTESPNAVQRFLREMRAAAQLSHPNVVHAHDADEVGGAHFIVMELLTGVDLGRRVGESGPLPVEQACEYVRQAALGLQHAHECGMVHRDIKPSNLLVTTDGTVKLLDLGLARLAPSSDGESSGALTATDSLMGTPDFMAPEQARQSHTVDGRADLFSLGATLYFLLTGRAPFKRGSLAATVGALLFEEAAPVEQARPEVPLAVAAVVRKLLEKDPAKRYQSAGELADVLARALKDEATEGSTIFVPVARPPAVQGDTVSAVVTLPTTPPAVRKPRRMDQRAFLVVAIVVVVTALAAAILARWFLANQPSAPAPTTGNGPGRGEAAPLTPDALVSRPAAIDGVDSWTLEITGVHTSLDPVALSPDGRWLAGAAVDGSIELFDGRTGEPQQTLATAAAKVRALIWSSDKDGLLLAAEGTDGRMHYWDAAAAVLLRTAPREVKPTASSNDGRIAPGGSAWTVRLWDAAAGRPLGTLVDTPKGAVVISADGHYRCYGCTPEAKAQLEDQVTYVARTEQGMAQYAPDKFAAAFHWKNDPHKARLQPRE